MGEGRWVLLIASEVGTESVSDQAMERLCEAIQEEATADDGLALAKSDPSFSAILLDWALKENAQFDGALH